MIEYASVFDGIGAVHVAWQSLGWRCAWTAEIEAFPAAVVEQRWGYKNLGDVTEIGKNGKRVKPVQLLVGGSPCQDFSLAGERAGLDGARGNLTLEYAELAHRLGSTWLVWENVPGVFSIDEGLTFAAILSSFSGTFIEIPEGGWRNSGIVEAGSDGYGLAWRVLDAQYFGVPQRRRRVFVVGYLGDWRPAAAVLFERSCLQGHPAPSRQAGQGPAAGLSAGASGRSNASGRRREDDVNLTVGTLDARHAGGYQSAQSAQSGHLLAEPQSFRMLAMGEYADDDGASAMKQRDYKDATDLVVTPLAFNVHGANSCAMKGEGEAKAAFETQTARALDTQGFTQQQGGTVVAFDTTQITSKENRSDPQSGDPCHPLAESADAPAIVYQCHGSNVGPMGTLRAGNGNETGGVPFLFKPSHFTRGKDGAPAELAPPLSVDADKGDQEALVFTERTRKNDRALETSDISNALQDCSAGGQSHSRKLLHRSVVRRLTPLEAERLQGFPDGYTLIEWDSKFKDDADFVLMCAYYRRLLPSLTDEQVKGLASDSPRYRALGNSMAVPVMRWLGERIQMVMDILKGLKK